MERVVELFFDHILKEFLGEGERRIKLQAFSACLEVIRGIRRLFLIAYFLCFACFLSAISFFSAVFFAFEQWRSDSPQWIDPRLFFSLGVFALSTFILSLTVRERKWSGAFRLEARIAELEATREHGFSEADLVRIVHRVLDERMKAQNTAPSDQA